MTEQLVNATRTLLKAQGPLETEAGQRVVRGPLGMTTSKWLFRAAATCTRP